MSFFRPVSADVPDLLPGALTRVLHDELVGHKRDELAVRRLVVLGIDVVTEELVDVLDLAPRQATSIEWRIARSTLEAEVLKRLAMPGYSSLVMRLMSSGSKYTMRMASRR